MLHDRDIVMSICMYRTYVDVVDDDDDKDAVVVAVIYQGNTVIPNSLPFRFTSSTVCFAVSFICPVLSSPLLYL
jgi:hypothetical protein